MALARRRVDPDRACIYLSLTPYPLEIPVPQGDKYGHVAAYATLMLWHCQIRSDTRFRVGWAITFIALGIVLEFMQRLTGYRTFEIDDMMADGAGVLLGWIAAPRVCRTCFERWRRAGRTARRAASGVTVRSTNLHAKIGESCLR